MAYDKVVVAVTYLDDYNRTTTRRYTLRTLDATQAELDAATLAGLISPITIGAIQKYSVQGIKEFTDSPSAGANLDAGCTMQVQLDGRPEKASIKYPMPLGSHFLPGGILNTGIAAIQSFVGAFEATGGICNISDGDQVEDDGLIKGTLDK
jgi:hypothetical protein